MSRFTLNDPVKQGMFLHTYNSNSSSSFSRVFFLIINNKVWVMHLWPELVLAGNTTRPLTTQQISFYLFLFKLSLSLCWWEWNLRHVDVALSWTKIVWFFLYFLSCSQIINFYFSVLRISLKVFLPNHYIFHVLISQIYKKRKKNKIYQINNIGD